MNPRIQVAHTVTEGDHRRRPRPGSVPHRWWIDPGGEGPDPGSDRGTRQRGAVPDHHGGSWILHKASAQIPARFRRTARLRGTGSGSRRVRVRRCGAVAPLENAPIPTTEPTSPLPSGEASASPSNPATRRRSETKSRPSKLCRWDPPSEPPLGEPSNEPRSTTAYPLSLATSFLSSPQVLRHRRHLG